MFSPDFYPTPFHVIEQMVADINLKGKTVFEPSAGKGNIVDFCIGSQATVIACELNPELREILKSKCPVIGEDFLKITSDKISHVDFIIMNPPFSRDEQHVLHAFDIAPAGCKIISLCNTGTVENPYSSSRKELNKLINTYGSRIDLGSCFSEAERHTKVNVSCLTIQKPGGGYSTEFDGFFTEEEPEVEGAYGIMSYNVVRDLVNRYIAAVKIFDEQLEAAGRMNQLLKGFYHSSVSLSWNEKERPIQRAQFKKDLQISGWKFIFDKMNLQKYTTRGVTDDINKFVNERSELPFTMKNIYRMLDIVIQTSGQRMDKAIEEVFDTVVKLDEDNKFYREGWKTNNHQRDSEGCLMNKKFIMPRMAWEDPKWKKESGKLSNTYGHYWDFMEDFVKALCYITGDNYDDFSTLSNYVSYDHKLRYQNKVRCYSDQSTYGSMSVEPAKKALYEQGIEFTHNLEIIRYGEVFEWAYFKVRAYRKGTMHFEFKDPEIWAKFNQRISKIKGYPLYESKPKTTKTKKSSQTLF